MANYGSTESLQSLDNGHVPECRMQRPETVQSLVQRYIDDDNEHRARKRALINGLVDGNAPYNSRKLREEGRADAANFNDGSGRSFLESGAGALYDLTSEAPGVVEIVNGHGNEEQSAQYSRTMSRFADLMFQEDESWDSDLQTSQTATVLHGPGPLFFDNPHLVLPRAISTGDLLVPSLAKSDLKRWDIAVILDELFPPELYSFIKNEKAAKAVGWNVEHTKLVIEHAIDQKTPEQRTYNWEWFQNELKTNSFEFTDSVRVCRLAHVYWKEFNGRITHVIVERQDNTGAGAQFLFKHVGRYENFYQIVNPMYFDKGRDGLHYAVTGLGTKMYGMMSYKNRLYLNLLDKAFAPKTLFKPTTAEAQTKFQLTRLGDYATIPPGTDVVQAPIQGFLTDGLAMHRTSDDILRSNLSQYRQSVQAEGPGNPPTAFQKRLEAAQQSSLSNTVFARYYKQLDLLYAEIVRRLCNLNSTDERAITFQKRCMDQGVPREAFGKIESTRAVRVIGQGSPFMRQQATQTMLSIMGSLPESGQENLKNDFIAAHAGQSAATRYNPPTKMSVAAGDQKERAGNQITGMHAGKPADFSSSQDPLIFATVYLQACIDAIGSVQSGGNPQEVLAFLSLCGPAAMQHIQRMQSDPFRQQIALELEKKWKRVAQATDRLKSMLQQQQAQAQQQQKKTQAVLTDQQLKEIELKADLSRKDAKLKHGLVTKSVTSAQQRAIADAAAASKIQLEHARTTAEIELAKAKAQSETTEE